jgi:hypothetical protein
VCILFYEPEAQVGAAHHLHSVGKPHGDVAVGRVDAAFFFAGILENLIKTFFLEYFWYVSCMKFLTNLKLFKI